MLPLALALSLGASPLYALVVSNNASNDENVAALHFADDDGARYATLFESQGAVVRFLSVLDAETQARFPGLAAKTRPPSRRELLDALAALNARMKADRAKGDTPQFVFVFTGHGKRGPAGEGSISLLGEAFTRSELFDQVLAPLQASTAHLIIDACDSYFFVNQRGGNVPTAPAQAALVTQFLEERTLAKYPDVGVILSTSSEQESHEWGAIKAGVFSHEVVSALLGAADVNADGRVEYSELRAFIAAANERVSDPRGKVAMFARAPARDAHAPLVDLSRPMPGSFLFLPARLEGRYWLEDAHGVRFADFNLEGDRPLVLLLPGAAELFLRSATTEASVTPAGGRVFDGAALAWRAQSVAARGGSLDDSFRKHLFERPYGARFYEGFVASSGELAVAPPAEADLAP
ncbi:MAG: hypothetical protein U0228_09605 [Myxococcaceae bacterium]